MNENFFICLNELKEFITSFPGITNSYFSLSNQKLKTILWIKKDLFNSANVLLVLSEGSPFEQKIKEMAKKIDIYIILDIYYI